MVPARIPAYAAMIDNQGASGHHDLEHPAVRAGKMRATVLDRVRSADPRPVAPALPSTRDVVPAGADIGQRRRASLPQQGHQITCTDADRAPKPVSI